VTYFYKDIRKKRKKTFFIIEKYTPIFCDDKLFKYSSEFNCICDTWSGLPITRLDLSEQEMFNLMHKKCWKEETVEESTE